MLLRCFRVFIFIFIFSIVYSIQVFADQTGVLLPVSDGNYAQWKPNSGSTHYTTVDESSCNGNTDFNRETTVGQRDSYGINLSSIPNNATITQIDITPCASKNTNGGSNTTLNVFYRLNGSDSSDAGNYSLSTTTPSVQSATGFIGLSTVKDGSTTLEIGAVYSAGNRGAKLSQITAVVTYTVASPTVTTNAATEITSTLSAKLNSTVNPNGGSTDVSYRYGTVNDSCSNLSNSTGSVNIGSGTSNVSPNSITLLSLTAGTTYYFCAVGVNSGGTTYGNVLSFVTPNSPTVTTGSAINITQTSASLSATVNPNRLSTDRYYRYDTASGECSSLTNSTSTVNIGSGSSDIPFNYQLIASLSANTTYYYCAVATNALGTTYGSVLSFTTLPNPPTVTTNDATNYTGTTSATLNSTVNPNGGSTTVYYKYGTSSAACSALPNWSGGLWIGSGTSDVSPNSIIINNLASGTTYYFCAIGMSIGGTSYGNVLSFTTDP
jgi:hypothetical protein